MALLGNVNRFTKKERSAVFAQLLSDRDQPRWHCNIRVQKRLRDDHGVDVSTASLKRMRLKYEEDDWVFIPTDRKRSGRPKKFTDDGVKAAVKAVKNKGTIRGISRRQCFEVYGDEQPKQMGRSTLRRKVIAADLVISIPKVIRIRTYCHHHRVQRMAYCKWYLSLSDRIQRGCWFSDEMSFSVALTPNKKNDICPCPPTDRGKHVPSASPELNLAENAQGYVRQLINDACKFGDEEWRGSVKKKMAVVMRIVNKLNDNGRYWKKLHHSQVRRCQWVLSHDGEIYRP